MQAANRSALRVARFAVLGVIAVTSRAAAKTRLVVDANEPAALVPRERSYSTANAGQLGRLEPHRHGTRRTIPRGARLRGLIDRFGELPATTLSAGIVALTIAALAAIAVRSPIVVAPAINAPP